MATIGIIDYGMGNLRSVQKAFQRVGADAVILKPGDDVDPMAKLILPGVGSFADGMEHLRRMKWIDPVKRFIDSGRPFLGICLGMQLLFAGSEEEAEAPDQLVPGLDVLPGSVVSFRQPDPPAERIKIPHMGWNTLSFTREDNPLFAGLEQGSAVYFVHGYYANPDDRRQVIAATADYPSDRPICAAAWRDNVWATQFHPEKSQKVGLTMLRNFASIEV